MQPLADIVLEPGIFNFSVEQENLKLINFKVGDAVNVSKHTVLLNME